MRQGARRRAFHRSKCDSYHLQEESLAGAAAVDVSCTEGNVVGRSLTKCSTAHNHNVLRVEAFGDSSRIGCGSIGNRKSRPGVRGSVGVVQVQSCVRVCADDNRTVGGSAGLRADLCPRHIGARVGNSTVVSLEHVLLLVTPSERIVRDLVVHREVALGSTTVLESHDVVAIAHLSDNGHTGAGRVG